MRYDIRILWVEDTPIWREEQKEIIEMHLSDLSLSSEITCLDDGLTMIGELNKAATGFKTVDIFLLDYNLSGGVYGNDIINILRSTRINADILLYSANNEKDIQRDVSGNLSSFEGVYIANRDNFLEKCLMLVEKNSRNLLSISNIRGFLMDQTSENDFIINSYICGKYNSLDPDEKTEVQKLVVNFYNGNSIDLVSDQKKVDLIKSEGSIPNIRSFVKSPGYIVPLELKYLMFEKIVEIKGERFFNNSPIKTYIQEVVKLRNTIAHKKLDVCKQQKYIQYYDNIEQYKIRKCPDDCETHSDEFKISLKDWDSLRKSVISYAKHYDEVLQGLMED